MDEEKKVRSYWTKIGKKNTVANFGQYRDMARRIYCNNSMLINNHLPYVTI
jgi:hypothetical protein